MRRLPFLAATLVVFLVVLTYFLAQGTSINAPRYERADALQSVILYDAELQRDVLLGRAGLLPNYDPLVGSMNNLRVAAADLPSDDGSIGNASSDIRQKTAEVARAVAEQEALVESFKSDNALLQNSLSYFNHLSQRLTSRNGQAGVAGEIGMLTAAMLRFINAPRRDLAEEVTSSINALERRAVEPPATSDVHSLISHARLIIGTLPRVDGLVANIQSAPLGRAARLLQNSYLQAHSRATRRANIFMSLLYGVAVVLMGYVAYLFVQLRANRDRLKARLELERLVAEISTRFINLPRSEIEPAAQGALAHLASHLKITGAELVLPKPNDYDGVQHEPADGIGRTESLARLIHNWRVDGHETQGSIHVPDIARLPDGDEKAALAHLGIRSLLSIPIDMAARGRGAVLLFHERPHAWGEDDVALVRTVAEVFANATIRERSEAEREDLQLRLNRSQRLEAIGTLAGGIAHEFNNILGAVRGYGEMALAILIKDSRARRYVLQIMKAGERAQDIVEQVLAFGRLREREQKLLDARTVVAEAVDLVRASLPATISLHVDLAVHDAAVMGDGTELQQVVVNLATNAAQAMNGSGAVRVVLKTVFMPHERELSHGATQAGRHVLLQVSDSGSGIDPAAMERIFEPFFTTKPAGQGTGLGLSTVHGIVSAHHGATDVQSKPGQGATFSVYLPQIEATVHPEPDHDRSVPQGHGETILIVENDESLMLLGEDMLAALGYEPVGFGHGKAALSTFRADPGRFDLILTDEIMPELRGTELASVIHTIRPDVPIVLMTGYTRTLKPERLQAAGIREVLKKPLLSRDLGDCLARQLPA
ncbi:two-component system VirA-like sensor kinase [Neorhizobium tomejilense]|uniref:two-component system VirA-like sensor kinase n=1 Tax=Neorhizobium tomejilense TaxID=2093828 RepID=UPI003ED06A36